MKALIDTCVIIDALQSREPFRKAAEEIFLSAANRRFTGFITAKSVTDIYYLTHRCTHSDSETRKILSTLLQLFSIADTTASDCRCALLSGISDYEDAVMAETALREKTECIVTRNVKDYGKSAVPVLTPDAFLSLLNAETNLQ